MVRGALQFQLQVPESLESQLLDYRRRVWKVKMFEAVGIAVFSILAAFLAVFVLDRIWTTPATVRAVVFFAALAGCAVAPLYLHRWVWRHRHLEQLARLLSRKLPRIGDQLLGVIELAHNEQEQARSRALCEAAIEQVAADAQHRDFNDAAPDSRHRLWITLASAAFGVALCLTVVFPAAAQNAWARLLLPWGDTPRYTFAAVAALPDKMVIPHGEPFTIEAKLDDDSIWRPARGVAHIGEQKPVEGSLKEDRYPFDLPPQTGGGQLEIAIGDSIQRAELEPKYRPELTSIVANVSLPEYLGLPDARKDDVRAGAASLVKGSRASFTATANRPLSSAQIDGKPVKPSGATISTAEAVYTEPKQLEIQWQDEFALAGKAPFKLAITPRDDEAPGVACEDLPRRKVLLDTEQLVFKVRATDDFGVKVVGMEWHGIDDELIDQPAIGERILGPGGYHKAALELTGTFSAKSLGIEPQTIELRIFAEDYLPGRERVYSAPCVFFVLSPEQHAIWVTEQMSKWHRQSLEVRDREMQLYETNKELRELSPEQLNEPENRKRIENQAAAERANSRRLAGLAKSGADLLKEASRNPEIGVGHLEKWAEMLKILKDISNTRMPSVADLLKQAAEESKIAAAKSPAQKRPTAGQMRDMPKGSGRPTETEDDGKKKPTVPAIADVETNQQPADKTAGNQDPQKKNPSSPRLTLPQTNTFGGKPSDQPPPPPSEKVDQAVKEQKDLLAEFEKIADELNAVLANLEGSTLMKRLKAASRVQYKVAGKIGDQLEEAFGVDAARTPKEPKEVFAKLGEEELKSSGDVSLIMDDMQAYFERRRLAQFKSVLEEMRTLDVLDGLRRLADDIPKEQGVSIAQAEFWSDTLDRWAEDLVDPACKGCCPGCKSKGSLPPSLVLEVLQILEAEVALREETRVAEQAKAAQQADEHGKEGQRLSKVQTEIEKRVAKVIERIKELPDAEEDFGKEMQLLGMVESVMHEAADILGQPNTGSPAIAAETEAIELLLRSKRIRPGGGGGGGSTPGGGGGGKTEDAAIALIGPGNNDKEVREDHGVSQATGTTGPTLPEEFRAGLNEYFNQLETQPAAR